MQEFTVAAIQMLGAPAPPDERLLAMDGLLARSKLLGVRLAVFPELSIAGYALDKRNFDLAETVPGPSVAGLCELARKHDILIVAGLSEKSGEHFFNTQVVVGPDGFLGRYRKIHVASAENAYWARGEYGAVVATDLGRLGLGICADMSYRTPWQNYVNAVDVVAVSSAWPDFRSTRPFPLGMSYRLAQLRCLRAIPEKISRVLGVPVIFANACGPLPAYLPPWGPTLHGLRLAGRSRVVQGLTLADDNDSGDEQIITATIKIGESLPSLAPIDGTWLPEPNAWLRFQSIAGDQLTGWLYRPLYAWRPHRVV